MNALFKLAFEASPVAMILVDEGGAIRLANGEAEKLFGYTRVELTARTVSELVPGSARDHHPNLVQSFFADPEARQMGIGRNLSALRKDGSSVPVEVGLNPAETSEGLWVISTILDISERLNAEERFRSVVESAPIGMMMVDRSGHIQLINRQIESMFGYERRELLGQPVEVLVPENIRAAHPAFVAGYFDAPRTRPMGSGRELHGLRKDGSTISVEIGLCPVHEDKGYLVVASVVDITERQTAETQLLERNAEIEEFAYRTSHDLRSPLLSVSGLADCIVEDLDAGDTDEALANARKIKSMVRKLNLLVDDILVLTRCSSIDEHPEEIDFRKLVLGIRQKYGGIIAEQDVLVEHGLGHDRPLLAQPTRVEQVLDNLVSNGIKYCDPSKTVRKVLVQTSSNERHFEVEVRDNGMGIPKEHQHELFGMFKQFHQSPDMGSGLGLYIVRKHLDAMSARVSLESSPAGTVFYLRFPLSAKA